MHELLKEVLVGCCTSPKKKLPLLSYNSQFSLGIIKEGLWDCLLLSQKNGQMPHLSAASNNSVNRCFRSVGWFMNLKWSLPETSSDLIGFVKCHDSITMDPDEEVLHFIHHPDPKLVKIYIRTVVHTSPQGKKIINPILQRSWNVLNVGPLAPTISKW